MCRRHDRSTRFHGSFNRVRRVHTFVQSIDTCHRDFIEYSTWTSGAKVFGDVSTSSKKLGHIRVSCVFRAFGFSFRQLFSPFRSSFFLFLISRTNRGNRSNSSLFSEKNFFFVYSVGHAASTPNYHAKLFSLMASLSPCYIRGLPFSQGFCNLNIQTFSYLCFPRFHIHLPSINHRAIPFIASSSLHFSIFTSSSSSGLHFTFLFSRLLLLLAFVPPCFPANRRRRGEGKKKSRIPGQRFQGSVTSLTNWLPRIQASLPRSCCSTDRAAYPLRLVEKRHRLVLRIRVESWPRESSV